MLEELALIFLPKNSKRPEKRWVFRYTRHPESYDLTSLPPRYRLRTSHANQRKPTSRQRTLVQGNDFLPLVRFCNGIHGLGLRLPGSTSLRTGAR